MNNKGFTLIEVLSVLIIISLIMVIAVRSINKTVSLSKEESYKIMKTNIIKVSKSYINECIAKTIECNFSFDSNNYFEAKKLKETGYFKNLTSPIDGKNLENCLIIYAKKEKGVVSIELDDKCY